MNKRKVYENMNISCNVISIGEVSCSYIGSLVLDENLVATLTKFDVEMDCYKKKKKFKDFCICAKAEKVYYTLKVDIVLSPSFSVQKSTFILFPCASSISFTYSK